MGKLTISTGPFSIANRHKLPGGNLIDVIDPRFIYTSFLMPPSFPLSCLEWTGTASTVAISQANAVETCKCCSISTAIFRWEVTCTGCTGPLQPTSLGWWSVRMYLIYILHISIQYCIYIYISVRSYVYIQYCIYIYIYIHMYKYIYIYYIYIYVYCARAQNSESSKRIEISLGILKWAIGPNEHHLILRHHQ